MTKKDADPILQLLLDMRHVLELEISNVNDAIHWIQGDRLIVINLLRLCRDEEQARKLAEEIQRRELYCASFKTALQGFEALSILLKPTKPL